MKIEKALTQKMYVKELDTFTSETEPVIEKVKSENPFYIQCKVNFKTLKTEYTLRVKKTPTKHLTAEINSLDNKRDSTTKGLFGIIDAAMFSNDAVIYHSAQRLKDLTNQYNRSIYKEPLSVQTVQTDKLIEKLETEYKNDVTNLNITNWVTTLKQDNTDVKNASSNRNSVLASSPENNASEVAKSLIKSYNKLASLLTFMSEDMGDIEATKAIEELNIIISSHNSRIRSRITHNQNQEVEETQPQ